MMFRLVIVLAPYDELCKPNGALPVPRYANRRGRSNVSDYEIFADGISVTFGDGKRYEYTNASAGADNIAKMKTLATDGAGLNSFINLYVKKRYARKSST